MSTPTLKQFERVEFNPSEFDHEAHVYIAWRYLQRYEMLEAIQRYRTGLQRIVKKFGAESKYHETITWFYMISIAERMYGESSSDWGAFSKNNPELFASNLSWVGRHYTPNRLASKAARTQFVLPDV